MTVDLPCWCVDRWGLRAVVVDHSEQSVFLDEGCGDLSFTIIREKVLNSATKVISFSRLFVLMSLITNLERSVFPGESRACSELDRGL